MDKWYRQLQETKHRSSVIKYIVILSAIKEKLDKIEEELKKKKIN